MSKFAQWCESSRWLCRDCLTYNSSRTILCSLCRKIRISLKLDRRYYCYHCYDSPTISLFEECKSCKINLRHHEVWSCPCCSSYSPVQWRRVGQRSIENCNNCNNCGCSSPKNEMEFAFGFEFACEGLIYIPGTFWFGSKEINYTATNIIGKSVSYFDSRLIRCSELHPKRDQGSQQIKHKGTLTSIRKFQNNNSENHLIITIFNPSDSKLHIIINKVGSQPIFKIIIHSAIEWAQLRLLFIAYHKEDGLFSTLSYEMLQYILQFLMY